MSVSSILALLLAAFARCAGGFEVRLHALSSKTVSVPVLIWPAAEMPYYLIILY